VLSGTSILIYLGLPFAGRRYPSRLHVPIKRNEYGSRKQRKPRVVVGAIMKRPRGIKIRNHQT